MFGNCLTFWLIWVYVVILTVMYIWELLSWFTKNEINKHAQHVNRLVKLPPPFAMSITSAIFLFRPRCVWISRKKRKRLRTKRDDFKRPISKHDTWSRSPRSFLLMRHRAASHAWKKEWSAFYRIHDLTDSLASLWLTGEWEYSQIAWRILLSWLLVMDRRDSNSERSRAKIFSPEITFSQLTDPFN